MLRRVTGLALVLPLSILFQLDNHHRSKRTPLGWLEALVPLFDAWPISLEATAFVAALHQVLAR